MYDKISTQCNTLFRHYILQHITQPQQADFLFSIFPPFLSIIDLNSTDFDYKDILDRFNSSVWFDQAVVILICNKKEFHKKNQYLQQYASVVAVIPEESIDDLIVGVMTLFYQNNHLIVNWKLQALVTNCMTDTYEFGNHHRAIPVFCTTLTRLMVRLYLLNNEDAEILNVALLELMINAVEHGNCEISFEDKNKWLETHGDTTQLIFERNKDPKIAKRKITLAFYWYKTHAHFQIADQGNGFDWSTVLIKIQQRRVIERHGYGITMAFRYTNNLTYNKKGNVVSFDYPFNSKHLKTHVPHFFLERSYITLQKGEVLIQENREQHMSNINEEHIYLIISGTLSVYRAEKQIGTFTAVDILCGEMSYLLQRQRTATVVADTEVRVATIPQPLFTTIINNNPYFGLFLARIIAMRLDGARDTIVHQKHH